MSSLLRPLFVSADMIQKRKLLNVVCAFVVGITSVTHLASSSVPWLYFFKPWSSFCILYMHWTWCMLFSMIKYFSSDIITLYMQYWSWMEKFDRVYACSCKGIKGSWHMANRNLQMCCMLMSSLDDSRYLVFFFIKKSHEVLDKKRMSIASFTNKDQTNPF